jgi:isoleucyl-tRNA synthetase
LEDRDDLSWPADLYLEGSDQHRGWFQSSLLESCGTRGRAPYEAVLTHGFTLDDQGRKMSKSAQNALAPDKIAQQSGAEILRLWTANTDYTEDQRLGPEILKSTTDAYRRLRNTIRFMLANLDDWQDNERIAVEDMPELERLILHRLAELDVAVRQGYNEYDFNRVFHELFNFCTNDLSAFFFDIRKDALYCDGAGDVRRRAARTVLNELFSHLTLWLSPILCFTMEEVWLNQKGEGAESVHLQIFPDVPENWRDDALAARWSKIREVRRVLTGALEVERREKRIGSSLEASVAVFMTDPVYIAALSDVDVAELAITSSGVVRAEGGPEHAFALPDAPGIAVVCDLAQGEKCNRCWMILPEVGSEPGVNDVCGRCSSAIKVWRTSDH